MVHQAAGICPHCLSTSGTERYTKGWAWALGLFGLITAWLGVGVLLVLVGIFAGTTRRCVACKQETKLVPLRSPQGQQMLQRAAAIELRAGPLAALAVLALILALSACGKPDLEWNCTMNGLGDGTCSFTNTGDAKGAVCGAIEVYSVAGSNAQSGKFCSGQVEPSSTTTVEFSIPDVRQTCDSTTGSWADVCDFGFLPAE